MPPCPYPGCGATTAKSYLAQGAGAGRMGHQLYCVILKNQWQRADGQGGWATSASPKTGLMEARFNVTRTWPLKTEAESSMHIRDKAAARSTILLVCRPAGKRNPKAWHQVAQNIAAAVSADLKRLQEYQLSPVDTYLAAYGPVWQVISGHWGTRRETANPDRPEDPFAITPRDALAVARAR